MAIKITYVLLSQIIPAVQKLRAVDKGATIVERARIARFVKPLWAELGEYEKLRNEIVAKFGEAVKDGAPGQFRIKPESAKAYADEFKALMAIEVELAISPLPVKLYEAATLSVEDMDHMGELIVWPKDEDEPPAPEPAAPGLKAVPPA